MIIERTKSDYLDQGQFHAHSAGGVEQEIYALCLLASLSRFLMAQAATRHEMPAHELSTKAGILSVADNLVAILLITDADRIARPRYTRRTVRSFPRRSFKR